MVEPDKPRDPSELATQVLARLRSAEIPPVPRNYALWFAYLSNAAPTLTRQMRLIEESSQGFSEETCSDLYARFVAAADQKAANGEISSRMQDVLASVDRSLQTMSNETANYGEALAGASKLLDSRPSTEQLVELVGELQQRNVEMYKQASSMRADLDRSESEIRTLRERLVETRGMAYTDELTGLGNRKLLNDCLQREITLAREKQSRLAMLVIDIDHFKKFNDNHGHRVGDIVLRLIAERLRRLKPEDATLARFGGEEFVMLLPGMSEEAVMTLANKICHDIKRNRVVIKSVKKDLGVITVSVGGTLFQPSDRVEEFFDRADAALYQAKETGRDRAVFAAHGLAGGTVSADGCKQPATAA